MHACTHTHTQHINTHACVSLSHTHTHTHTHVQTHTHTHTNTHTHTHTQKHLHKGHHFDNENWLTHLDLVIMQHSTHTHPGTFSSQRGRNSSCTHHLKKKKRTQCSRSRTLSTGDGRAIKVMLLLKILHSISSRQTTALPLHSCWSPVTDKRRQS